MPTGGLGNYRFGGVAEEEEEHDDNQNRQSADGIGHSGIGLEHALHRIFFVPAFHGGHAEALGVGHVWHELQNVIEFADGVAAFALVV